MYYLNCQTCEDEDAYPELEAAQVAFNEHARQLHEVVLRRIPAGTGDSNGDDTEESTPIGANDGDV